MCFCQNSFGCNSHYQKPCYNQKKLCCLFCCKPSYSKCGCSQSWGGCGWNGGCGYKPNNQYIFCKCECKKIGGNSCGSIHQPAFCPLICPKNFCNYSPDFWEKGFGC